MWFSSKSAKQKPQKHGSSRFLRKGLSKRYEARAVTVEKEKSRVAPSVIVLWSLFLATLFYLAFFSVFFHISEPQVSGMSKISEENVREFVRQEMAGKYFGIFPKRDFFLVTPHILKARLLSEYPLFASARVTRIFPDGIDVQVTEREKIILWCSGEPCFLIDEEGTARENSRALDSENISHVLFIADQSGKAVTAGEKVFDPNYGTFVTRLGTVFGQELGFTLEPRMTTVSRFSSEVRAKTSEGWEAYLNTEIPLESSLNVLKLLFEKELPPEVRARLAYIDLRAENRAYYVLKEDEKKEEENTDTPPQSEEEKAKLNTESAKKKKK